MSKNVIQNIVIIMGILIILAFLAIIYGMYLKISTSDTNLTKSVTIYSNILMQDEKIKNIEVIDNKRLLIVIESKDNIKGAIYNIENNQVITLIDR